MVLLTSLAVMCHRQPGLSINIYVNIYSTEITCNFYLIYLIKIKIITYIMENQHRDL